MKKISNTLVRKVFTTYFAVAAIITMVHLGVQLYDEEERVVKLLDDYRGMTISALGTGLWNFDGDSLASSLEGVIEAPLICRAVARSPKSFNGDVLADVVDRDCPVSQDKLLPYKFSVMYSGDGVEQSDVGTATFYYNGQFALANAIDRAFLIIALSLVKTAILGLIIVYWARRLVKDPLKKISEFCGSLSEQEHHDYQAQIHSEDEISELERSFIKLLDKVRSLSQESRAKSNFLSNISHELRTPLNAIIGYSQMLIEDLDCAEKVESDDIKKDLKSIESSGSHLLCLINEILDMAKVESEQFTLRPNHISPSDLAQQVKILVSPLMVANSNQFSIEVSEQVKPLYTDASRLKQILLNLLSNAAKYTHNGLIILKIEPIKLSGSEAVSFSVRDSGQGISPQDLRRVFDKFVQVHDASQDKYSGTGIGLSLSKGLAQKMGGNLTATSILGEGSCFRLVIPLEDPRWDATQVLKPSKRLMIMDDDSDILDLAQEMIGDICHVEVARTLDEALGILTKQPVDLLYLDIHMPVMDGLKVLAEIRRLNLCPPKVYFLSGTSISSYLVKAQNAGVEGIIEKPLSIDKLLQPLNEQRKAS
ncbi:ATP-binding response regulator [Pseudobacteriovorax antillogorgiicola]|uniref:histidine kinase n=1 Tax=Pseudobacteriovorax antillogorgiicola TaxID=1513793 RepID=A0A1Y6BHJ4_9BACT|nr:ATP-binding protein [Pseudobacteriovorax antillogorgiicola]TCS55473.1 signal transduction histidine kinase [Pseudobacteriovorax antillogorgiicola]SMF12036.1 Signal transduction histidine kinase [Pseudobacteriovorax antillogorgiicola]